MIRHGTLLRAALVAQVACGSDSPSSCNCLADPVAHCVATQGCKTDADCAAGLVCLESPGLDLACPATAPGRQCRWAPRALDARALYDGFPQSGPMMVGLQASPLAITWQSPPDSRLVACGVFSGNPVFAPGSLTLATGEHVARIANFEAIRVQFYVSRAVFSSVPLIGATEYATPVVCTTSDPIARRVLSRLSIGCWAYDDTHIVAASTLIAVAPTALADILPSSTFTPACTSDGNDCYVSTSDFFGSCVSGICEPRCVDAQDCEAAARTYLGEPPSETCGWQCHPVAGSVVGVCAHSGP